MLSKTSVVKAEKTLALTKALARAKSFDAAFIISSRYAREYGAKDDIDAKKVLDTCSGCGNGLLPGLTAKFHCKRKQRPEKRCILILTCSKCHRKKKFGQGESRQSLKSARKEAEVDRLGKVYDQQKVEKLKQHLKKKRAEELERNRRYETEGMFAAAGAFAANVFHQAAKEKELRGKPKTILEKLEEEHRTKTGAAKAVEKKNSKPAKKPESSLSNFLSALKSTKKR